MWRLKKHLRSNKTRRNTLLIIALMISCASFSQKSFDPHPVTIGDLSDFLQTRTLKLGLYNITSMDGRIDLDGDYRRSISHGNNLKAGSTNSFLTGRLIFSTDGYVWHPNFLILSADAEYSPGAGQREFLVMPDQVDTRTLNSLMLTGTFFKKKPIGLNTSYRMGSTLSNRGDFSKIRTNYNGWRSRFWYRTKYLPIMLGTSLFKSKIKDLLDNSNEQIERNNFTAHTYKTFSGKDKSELEYSQEQQLRKYRNGLSTKTTYKKLNLSNRLLFGQNDKNSYISRISGTDQSGYYQLRKLAISEKLKLTLPKNFLFDGGYNYFKTEQIARSSDMHIVSASMQHQLYLSLRTTLSSSFQRTIYSASSLDNNHVGITFNYTKKVPTGTLRMVFGYVRSGQKMKMKSEMIYIIAEQHALSDGQIELLENANVSEASVLVRDITGLILYQLNIDYTLIKNNDFLEIRRLPTSSIVNNETVLVDYSAARSGSYSNSTNGINYAFNLDLFKGLLNLNFRTTNQKHLNQENVESLTLATYAESVYGAGINTKIANASIEYTDRASNILPYQMVRYSIGSRIRIRKRFLISMNGNYRDYFYSGGEGLNQNLLDISLRNAVRLRGQTKLSIGSSYRSQTGDNLNDQYFVTDIEYTVTSKKMDISLKLNYYNRKYTITSLEYSGAHIRLSRRL